VCDCGFVVVPPKQLSRSLIRIGGSTTGV
jgi:hypothetical protein